MSIIDSNGNVNSVNVNEKDLNASLALEPLQALTSYTGASNDEERLKALAQFCVASDNFVAQAREKLGTSDLALGVRKHHLRQGDDTSTG